MKNKKMWIFIGIIVLILVLNQHFSGGLPTWENTENFEIFGKYGTG